MLRVSHIKISVKEELTEEKILNKIKSMLKCSNIEFVRIVKKSVDARDKENVQYEITADVKAEKEYRFYKRKNAAKAENKEYKPYFKTGLSKRPVIIGFGPAGMFAALMLARAGAKPLIFERGQCVEKRQEAVKNFWLNRKLDTTSNVQFGEGGAGTFSDGKLTTGIKDVRCRYVLKEFVKFGAPAEILYESKPHIGTDRLVEVVRNIRNEIISLGGEIHFENFVNDIIIENGCIKSVVANGIEYETDSVILAVGHSARDTFEMLCNKGIDIVQKPFAMGVRIEHLQELISRAQYGEFYRYLPPADYKLFAHLKNGRSAYTFCMCPGGVVAGAASEEGMVVTNGMSYYKRDGRNANSALLIGINTEDFGSDHPLAGVMLQRSLERKAFEAGGYNYNAPVQRVGDFIKNVPSKGYGSVVPTYMPGVTYTDIRQIFPDFMNESFELALKEFDRKIKGFACDDAVMTAVESRSSSPVRILRGDDYQAVSVRGLYPCGEGCGYAGGIMSAAVDGIRCSEAAAGKGLF